jgi:hypothetical protein
MLYKLMNDILPGGSVSRFQKLYITLIMSFSHFFVYHILHFLFLSMEYFLRLVYNGYSTKTLNQRNSFQDS